MSNRPRRLLDLAVLALAVSVAAAMYVRLHYSADYSDEGFHVAMSYRFVLGDRPFVDELSLAQGYGLVAAPAYYPYVKLFGTEGIFLYGRRAYWLLTVVTALLVWSALRPLVRGPSAVCAALLCVGFSSGALPSLSYDNMAIAFFTAGVFLGTRALLPDASVAWHLGAGACHAMAVMGYLPLALAVIVYVALQLAFGSRRRRFLAFYALSGVAAALPILVAMFRSGIGPVAESMARTRDLYHAYGLLTGTGKIIQVARDIGSCAKHTWWLGVIGAVLVWAFRAKRPRLALAALAVYPFALLTLHGFRPSQGFDSPVMGFVLYYGTAAVFLVACLWRDDLLRRAGLVVAGAALGSAVAMGYASGGGYTRFAVGMLPAAVLSVGLAGVVAQRAWAERFGTEPPPAWLAALFVVLAAPVVVEVALAWQWGCTSSLEDRLVPLDRFTRKIPSGPFRGLYGDVKSQEQFALLEADLAPYVGRDRRKAFSVGIFVAGYLFMQARPAAKMVLGPAPSDFDDCEKSGELPGLVLLWTTLKDQRFDGGVRAPPFERARRFLAEHPYQLAARRADYDLYVLDLARLAVPARP